MRPFIFCFSFCVGGSEGQGRIHQRFPEKDWEDNPFPQGLELVSPSQTNSPHIWYPRIHSIEWFWQRFHRIWWSFYRCGISFSSVSPVDGSWFQRESLPLSLCQFSQTSTPSGIIARASPSGSPWRTRRFVPSMYRWTEGIWERREDRNYVTGCNGTDGWGDLLLCEMDYAGLETAFLVDWMSNV